MQSNVRWVVGLVLVLSASSVQGLAGQHATVGFTAGFLRSWAETEWGDGYPGPSKAVSAGNRSGMAASIHIWRDVLPWLGIQAELAASRRAFEDTQPSYGMTYIEALGSIDIRPFPEAGFIPYLRIGLGPAWIVGCSVQMRETAIGPVEGQCDQVQTPWEEDYGVAPLDLTALVGLGLEKDMNQQRLRAELRVGRGLRKVYNSRIFDYNYFATLQVSLGKEIGTNGQE